MKKLLSLIGTLTIVGSPVATVIACGTASPKNTDQDKANAIKNKIKTTAFEIDNNKTLTVAANTAAIKSTLKKNNSTLTTEDLAKITFAPTKPGASFVPGTELAVTATITVGTAKTTVALQVTMHTNDQQKADDIAAKITKTALTIPDNTVSKTVTANTKAIKTALGEANPKLTDPDLAKIGFSTGALALGKAVNVTATITVGVATATATLQVTMKRTDQQEADAIKDKISDPDLAIPAAASKTVADNTKAIKTKLKTDNPTLTDDDIATMKFSTGTFTPGTALGVVATITVGKATATKALQVTMAQTAQEKADDIAAKITKTALTIAQAASKTVADNTVAIKTALKTDNPILTNDDIATMMFAPKTPGAEFKLGLALDVTATITVGAAKATTTLQVTMAQTDQQKADAIKEKITDPNLNVPLKTNSSTANQGTITAIKTALKGANPTLTDDPTTGDLAKIAFNTVTLTVDSAVNVTATIKVGTATATTTLQITRTISWNQSKSILSFASIYSAPVKIDKTYYLGTGGNGLYTSTDGTTWTQSKSIPTSANIHAAPVKIDSTYYLATNGSGLYTSTNGTSWTQSKSIPNVAEFFSAPVKIGSTYYLGSTNVGLYTSTDGTSWTKSSIPNNPNIWSTPVKIDSTYYLATRNKGLYTSTDGTTWTQSVKKGFPTSATSYFGPVKIDKTYYLGTSGNGLYISTDGTTWTQSTSISTYAIIYSEPVKIGNTYYLSTRGTGLYTSTDGTTWTQSTTIPTSADIYAAPVKIGNTYYLSTNGNGLYTSTDGTTWIQSKGIPSNIGSHAAPVQIGDTYYLSTEGDGLYFGT